MTYIDILTKLHTSTQRDYLERVVKHDKAKCAEMAIQYEADYWDGDRSHGYGGYRYDGRQRAIAEQLLEHYDLPEDAAILDIGCGKGFLLYEFTQLLPRCTVTGIDVSKYGIANSKEEVRSNLHLGNATDLPFDDDAFDLVVSVNTFHNLYNFELHRALQEMERVGRGAKYYTAESYRNEAEKVHLMYWQLTCRTFHTPEEWAWVNQRAGYTGDHGLIFFE